MFRVCFADAIRFRYYVMGRQCFTGKLLWVARSTSVQLQYLDQINCPNYCLDLRHNQIFSCQYMRKTYGGYFFY